jgi:hypothetical protein
MSSRYRPSGRHSVAKRLPSTTQGTKKMKTLITAILIALPLCATSAFAATAQQSKMAACSKENKGLKGDEYKAAQKACLSKDAAPAKAAATSDKHVSQKQKMAACAKENKGLKGDEYKNAQKECLSK